MSDMQSQLHAALEEAQRADQQRRAAAEALRVRQDEYEAASRRGRQQQIKRAKAALEAARLAYDAAEAEAQQFAASAEEVVQAQIRAAYM